MGGTQITILIVWEGNGEIYIICEIKLHIVHIIRKSISYSFEYTQHRIFLCGCVSILFFMYYYTLRGLYYTNKMLNRKLYYLLKHHKFKHLSYSLSYILFRNILFTEFALRLSSQSTYFFRRFFFLSNLHTPPEKRKNKIRVWITTVTNLFF